MSASEDSIDAEVTVGSPDSGVEELASSINRFNLAQEAFQHPPSPSDSSPSPVSSTSPDDLQERDNHVGKEGSEVGQRHREMSVSSDDTGSRGGESGEGEQQLLRGERVEALRELLETYLSDNYLTRDIFLLKYFRRSREGWISLKFMAAYKRIRRTSGRVEEVREAARSSPLLQVNAEGTKVRRRAPLPACIEDYIPTRTALLADLPPTLRTLTALTKYLGPFGSVTAIQLLRPGMALPDQLQETVVNFPKVREQWCALVEFDEIGSAQEVTEAVEKEGGQDGGPGWALELVLPWRNGKTTELGDPSRQWCRSCPSSGYSSPCLTPDQSPSVAARRSTRTSSRGLTKRERLALERTHPHVCHSHACLHQLPCGSPGQSPRKYRPLPVSRRHDKITEATRSDNWRAPITSH